MFLLGGLLHRMIFWELVKVFCLALTSLTGLFLIGLVIQQANQLGLSLFQTLALLPLLVPYTLPYTIPATTLFATCVVYGRLSHDNEAVAMKAAGVNLLTVVRPAVTLGLITAAATFVLAHTVIPHTQAALQRQLLQDPEEMLYNYLKRDKSLAKVGKFPYVIYVRDVQGRRLIDVVVKKKEMVRDPMTGGETWTGKYALVVRAREARLRVALPEGAGPDDPPMLYIDPDRWASVMDNVHANVDGNRPIGVALPEAFSGKELRDKAVNLTWPELPPKAAEFRARLAREREQMAADKAALAAEPDPLKRKVLEAHVTGLGYMVDHWLRQVRNTECEYYMRPALALGCLAFALVGCPVGMWANRADYLSAFVTCFLPTVCVYYPLLLAGSNMGRSGKVPMPVGVLASDAIVGLLAVVLTVKLIRR